LENYTSRWHSVFVTSFINSLLSASLSTALALLLGVPAAYVVALDWARIGAQEIHFDPTFMHGAVWLTLMEQHRKLV